MCIRRKVLSKKNTQEEEVKTDEGLHHSKANTNTKMKITTNTNTNTQEEKVKTDEGSPHSLALPACWSYFMLYQDTFVQ